MSAVIIDGKQIAADVRADVAKKVAELKENIHNRIIKNFTWEQTAKSVKEELEKYE